MNKLLADKYFLLLGRIILALVFVFSGIEKISDPDSFAVAIINYKIIPVSLVNIVAITIPWIELVAGVLLLFGIVVRESSLVLNSLLILFIVLIIVALLRGLNIDCGCFGSANAQKIGLLKIIENMVLLIFGLSLQYFNSNYLTLESFGSNENK